MRMPSAIVGCVWTSIGSSSVTSGPAARARRNDSAIAGARSHWTPITRVRSPNTCLR